MKSNVTQCETSLSYLSARVRVHRRCHVPTQPTRTALCTAMCTAALYCRLAPRHVLA